MAQELSFLKAIPGRNLEGAKALLVSLHWDLDVQRSDKWWSVSGGHKQLLKTTSREAVDAFVYGMALAYATLPEDLQAAVKRYADESTR